VAIDWATANEKYLSVRMDEVSARFGHQQRLDGPPVAELVDAARSEATALGAPPALDTLCDLFDLGAFERDLLVSCVSAELRGTETPTFGMAVRCLGRPSNSALTTDGPLRRWGLVEIGPGATLLAAPLRIDERVLHYLLGQPARDARVAALARPVVVAHDGLVASQAARADRLASACAQAAEQGRLPVVQLFGNDATSLRAMAAAVGARLGVTLWSVAAQLLPTQAQDLEAFIHAWEREAVLDDLGLLLECDQVDANDAVREAVIRRVLVDTEGLLLLTGRERRAVAQRRMLTAEVERPTQAEQRAVWQCVLGNRAVGLDRRIQELVSNFDLSVADIQAACLDAALIESSEDGGADLWASARAQARAHLDTLAQRIEPMATWDDLIVSDSARQTLREMAAQVGTRAQVYSDWGFADRSRRDLGISALFAGPSGTGKTMAAEVLARELRLDLYRVDLSAVVSKYIGETEKNLRAVFDAAEQGGVILLFDEADALFGKRSEVRDSHDRYANVEISYLLQRMEAYRGLAILTTNMQDALDPAFSRRIRFVLEFPVPDVDMRAEIWRRIFPTQAPTDNLRFDRLAQLNMPGGSIRNIALNAAFLAAAADEPVTMAHLLRAAESESHKLRRPLSDGEVRGWVE
jgi:AAA+ superfamily predicted ATPase